MKTEWYLRLIVLTAAMLMIVGLVACASSPTATPTQPAPPDDVTDAIRIGLVLPPSSPIESLGNVMKNSAARPGQEMPRWWQPLHSSGTDRPIGAGHV